MSRRAQRHMLQRRLRPHPLERRLGARLSGCATTCSTAEVEMVGPERTHFTAIAAAKMRNR